MITQNCKQIPCLCSPLPHNLSRSVYVYTLPSYRVKLWLQVSTWSVFVTVLCFALFIVSLLSREGTWQRQAIGLDCTGHQYTARHLNVTAGLQVALLVLECIVRSATYICVPQVANNVFISSICSAEHAFLAGC